MRKSLVLLIALAIPAYGQDMILSGAGSPKVAGSSYTGPGDIASGAYAWWGFRAYSAAKAAAHVNVARVCNSSGAGCINISANTNGTITAPGGTACGGSACTLVTTLYDQSGANNCSSAPCDLTQITTANMPTFNGSGVISMSLSTTLSMNSPNVTLPSTNSASTVFNRTSNNGNAIKIIEDNSTGNGPGIYLTLAAYVAGSGVLTSNTVTVGTPSAVQYLMATSGSIVLDGGTAATGNTASFAPTASTLGVGQLSSTETSNLTEVGVWASDISSHFSTMNTNQHTFWGF